MTASEKPILVLAATGKTGRRVVQRLEAQGHQVRKGSRSAEIPFEWSDESTWPPVLAGVRSVFVVYTPDLAVPKAPAQITRFVELAKNAGVERLVLLSGRGETEAERCEQIALQSGIDTTIVRASWFNQNFSEGVFLEMLLEGALALPVTDTPEPFIDVDDIADVAVAALTKEGHAGEIYDITGPRLMTFEEAVKEIAEASGKSQQFVTITSEQFAEGVRQQNLPEDYVWLLNYLFTEVLDGRNASVTDDVERAIGRPARDFSEYVKAAAEAGAWGEAVEA